MTDFKKIIDSTKPSLVDFFAEWCGPCKMMPPILKDLKNMVGDSAIIIKIDVDKNPQVANKYTVRSVPTLILFKNGQEKWRQSGVMSAKDLKAVIDRFGDKS